MIPSHSPASHLANATCSARSDDDKPLVVDQALAVPNLPVAASTASLDTSGELLAETKFVSRARSTRLSNKASAEAVPIQMAEATSLTKSGSGSVRDSGSHMNIGAKRSSKALKDP